MPTREITIVVGERRTGHALTEAANDLDKLGRGLDATGGKFKTAANDLDRLNLQLRASRDHVKDLHRQFAATGDVSLFGDISKEEQNIRRLQKSIKALTPDVHDFMKQLDFSDVVSEGRGALIAGAVGLGAAMAPAIAAVISSAVLGAVGAGGVVGGAFLAAKDPRVRAAWGALGHDLMTELAPAGKAFVDPLVRSAAELGKAVQGAGIVTTLEHAATLVEPLTKAIGGFVRELGPGLRAGVEGALPTFNVLAKELPELGADVSHMLADFKAVGPEAALGMKDFLHVTGQAVAETGDLLAGLTEVNAALRAIGMQKIGGHTLIDYVPVGGFVEVLGKAAEAGTRATPVLTNLGRSGREVTSSMQGAANATAAMTETLTGLQGVWRVVNDEVERSTSTQAALQIDTINFENDLQGLADQVYDVGTNLDITTVAGRENQRSLIDAAKDARQMRDDQLALGVGLEAANAALRANEARLLAQAAAANMDTAAVYGLIHALFAVPSTYGEIAAARTFNPNTGLEGRRAAGGPVMPGGAYLVGEHGPELLQMGSQSGYVTPGGMGQTPVVISFAATGDPLLDAILQALRKHVRVNGGVVQTVLGP